MDNTTVFSKTGKGLLEVKNRSNRITKEQYRILSLVDGKANLDDLADRARMNVSALRQILTQLSESGYIKVLVSSSANDTGLGAGAITGSYYVDDLDFTSVLGAPGGKRASVYQSAETERRQRESAERKAAEAAATKRRVEQEQRQAEETARKAKADEFARKVREDAERKAQQEAQRQAKLEAELSARLAADRKSKEAAIKRARAEAEAKLKEDLDRQIREAAEKKRQEDARQLAIVQERQRKEEEERKRKEEEQRKRREAEDLRRREEAERQRKEEEERKRKEEEERKRHEEEERRRREEAERQRKEEEERKRKEEEERKRREEEERRRGEEEERKRKEEEERKRKEEEERKRREEEERRRHEEEERKRKEEEERKRKEEEERKRREEEERKRKDEERKRKEEEERKRKEEEERKRREEEERKRKEEEERKRREEEERLRREEEARMRKEEERKRKEEEERKHQEEERMRREEEERRQREEKARQEDLEAEAEEQRLLDEVKRRKAERERRRREGVEANLEGAGVSHGDSVNTRGSDDDQWLLDELARLNAEDLARPKADQGGSSQGPLRTAREHNEGKGAAAVPAPSTDTVIRVADAGAASTVAALGKGVGDAAAAGSEERTIAAALDLSVVEVTEEIEAPPLNEAGPQTEQVLMTHPATGVTEDDIRNALEEQERRWRMEEEARSALERAEFEAQLKAEREAREIAEAAEQARREAEERAREEAERLRKEEKERREQEEEARRKQKEIDRRAREQARLDAERRKREEDLIRQRKEQEERELRKQERDRIQKDLRRAQITPLRIAAALILVCMVVVGLLLQFATLNAWAPDIERIASHRIGEPVHIKSVRGNLFPIQLVLEGVTVGSAQDIRAHSVTVIPQLGSVFSTTKVLDALEIRGATIGADGLKRIPAWLRGPGSKGELVEVSRVQFRDSTLNLQGVALPNVNADIRLGRDGSFLALTGSTVDEHLRMDLIPSGDALEISIKGRNFTMPVGPNLEVGDLQAFGRLAAGELHLSRVEYFAYGGQGRAELRVRWQDRWAVESTFDFQRVSLESTMRALGIQLISDGGLDAKGMMRFGAANFADLFNRPEIDASFTARRGNLSGFDIPRALQQRHREGVQGGKTRYEEITGTVSSKEGHYQYRQVKLTAGILKATGQVDISAQREVSGRLSAELRSSAGVVRGNFNVSGNDQATLLKP